MLLSQCYKAEQSEWGSGSEYIVFCNSMCVCLCVCVCLGGRRRTNKPEYHHLANIRAEEIKILKVTEQIHQEDDATINWKDKGSGISEGLQ